MKFLLAVEDRDLIDSLSRYLKTKNIQTDFAYDGVQAINYIKENNYDCLIIDLKLSRITGLEVVKRILDNNNKTPILVLTNKTDIDENVLQLNLRVTDYLNKPFFINDFNLILNSIFMNLNSDDFYIGKITFSPSSFSMTNLNSSYNLTSRELDIIRYINTNKDNYTTLQSLSKLISIDEELCDCDMYIKSINKKLKSINSNFHIGSFLGKGYKLVNNYD